MSSEYSILMAEGRWLIACDDGESVQITDVCACGAGEEASLAEAVKSLGVEGKSFFLALPAERFYWASITTDSGVKKPTRQAMLYRLEEHLPVDAEELSAGFVLHNDRALGLAVPASEIQDIINRLQRQGIDVEAVAPRTWLALQEFLVAEDVIAEDLAAESPACKISAAMLLADGQAELWTLSPGAPTSGSQMDLSVEECVRALKTSMLLGEGRGGVLLLDENLSEDIREAVKQAWPGGVKEVALHLNTLAARAAHAHLSGSRTAWVNCLQGALTPQKTLRRLRRPLVAAAVLLLCLLTVSFLGILFRTWRYDSAASHAQQQQEQVFAKLHPGAQIPLSVCRRLEGEWRQSSALRGLSSDLPQKVSALDSLYEIVRLLPGDLRIRFTEIRIEPDTISLEGQARSHADAEAVATALRKSGLLDLAAPRTDSLSSGGVTFVLTGKPLVAKTVAKTAAGEGKP